ncbi:hypothetical protein BJV78DRAFT_1277654 [Lactifluus subvellereus]|nr:hypothetical protein BJV78DRAFT_1277654 [Lactifluus subvellereus]
MTVQSPDQLVTVIHQIQNSIEVIITSQKQPQELWTTTLDALTHLGQLVQGLKSRDSSPELQRFLNDLHGDLETMHVECRRYSKKKGLLRVSAMLPKRMVRKYIEPDLVRLREKIYHIHNSFEKRFDNVPGQDPNTAGPSASGRLEKQTGSRVHIPQPYGASREIITAGITERRIGPADTRQIPTSSSTLFFSTPASATAEIEAESEDWVMDDPEDWGVILTTMRDNVQSCAASILGQPHHGPGDHHVPIPHSSKASGSKGISPSTQSNVTLDLRRLEIRLLMGILSFTPPDLCPPNDQFQAVKRTPSYPIVIAGYSWEVAVRQTTDLFYSVDVSDMETGSPEAASKLLELSQSLEDLCMHSYSYTVATWALQLRRGLYRSDKDMHRRDLASAFCLKSRALARVGRIDDAIIAARGAVQLCHEDQALQGVQLAKALHVHASSLNAAGKKSEAKVVAMEMVEVLRALGEDKPHLKHFLSLARAFLSGLLVDMEEYQQALAMSQAATKSARNLIGAVDSRAALTIALLMRARALAARGEKGSAYVAAVEAVRHLRDLASERPVFTTFLAHALLLSSRYLQAAGFFWEGKKHAEEAVEMYRILHTSAPQAFARHYAEAVGYVVQLRTVDGNIETDVFDMAQHAAGLFREASLTDSDTFATVLAVVATSLLEAGRLREAAAPAEEAVGIVRDRWTKEPGPHASPLVGALRLASSCLPGTEGGLEYAKEAVQVHKERKDLERAEHDEVLTYLLMDVFSRLRELGREVEAIKWKTEATKLNGELVESNDHPEAGSAAQSKGSPGDITEHESGSEDDIEEI